MNQTRRAATPMVYTNLESLREALGETAHVSTFRSLGPFSVLPMVRSALRADYVILDFDSRPFLFFTSLKLLTFARFRLVCVDLFLSRPVTLKARISLPLRIILLRRVHRFLVYTRRTEAYERIFRLRPDAFRYLPYKVNALDLILRTTSGDDGYVFSGGKSRRDFQTFVRAIAPLGIPAKIMTSPEHDSRRHGTTTTALPAAEMIQVIHNDSGLAPFVDCMSRARLVVIPLLKDEITQAGIAVYLMAMALRKCVVISRGIGVDDVIPDGAALFVEPGDEDVLRETVLRVWHDEDLRSSVAAAGYHYAMSLGDFHRVASDIANWIAEDRALN